MPKRKYAARRSPSSLPEPCNTWAQDKQRAGSSSTAPSPRSSSDELTHDEISAGEKLSSHEQPNNYVDPIVQVSRRRFISPLSLPPRPPPSLRGSPAPPPPPPRESPSPAPCEIATQVESLERGAPIVLGEETAPTHAHAPPSADELERRFMSVEARLDGELAILGRDNAARLAETNEIRRTMQELRAHAESMVSTVTWLVEIISRLDPASARAAMASRPPPATPHAVSRGRGGGVKTNISLQQPFMAELRRRMGLGPNDPWPPFEAHPPTLGGHPVLRLDWDRRPEEYVELVGDILRELEANNRDARERIQAHGSHDAGVQVCFPSFARLFRRYRQQERLATQPDVAATRSSKRRQSTRAQKKTKRRSSCLADDEELRRRFHGFNFVAIKETMSAEVSDADEESQPGPRHHGGSDGGDSDGHAHALVVVAPPWRSRELHDALGEIDARLEQRLASAVTPPPTKTRPRRRGRVYWPTSAAAMPPLPSTVQRWMVNGEFAKRYPHLVIDVSLNPTRAAEANSATAIIRTPEQWGQQPHYRIHEPAAGSMTPTQAATAASSSSGRRSSGSELLRGQIELDDDDHLGAVHGSEDNLDPDLRDQGRSSARRGGESSSRCS